MNFVIKGEVLKDAKPFFFGASLVALSKTDGGVGPIAVGCTLRRLVAKCASGSIGSAMGELLSPLQVGYGTPSGAEDAVHAARMYLSNTQHNQLMLKLDFHNAFNSIRRDVMLHSVLKYIPELYPLAAAAYGNPTLLFFGNSWVESVEGVQQGDPLGPLFFSLTVHHLLSQLSSEFKVFYLDDGTPGGTVEEVVNDLVRLEDTLGLVLNHRKTEVVSDNAAIRRAMLAIHPDLKWVDPADVCLLG